MYKDYFSIATRSLTKRKTRTYLTMIGIFIGIAAVVSLIGLGQGLSNAISSQFGILGTDILTIQASGLNFGPPGTNVPTPLTDKLADKLENVKNVDAVLPRYIATVKSEFNNRQEVGFAGSIPIGENRKVFEKMVNLKIAEGRLLKDTDNKRVVVGSDFTTDKTYGRRINIGDKIKLNDIEFEVIGILQKKGSFIFDSGIYINEDVMLDTIKEDDGSVNAYAVKVKDQTKIDETQSDIERLLRKERNVKEGEEDFTVQSAQKALENLNDTLKAITIFIGVIASISLLVGGIGIMNTMYTAVLERSKEIGIMKAIGAKNSTIFILFFIESGLLGLIGGIIGVMLGLIFAYGFAFMGKIFLGSDLIQASVSIWLMLGALAFAFVLGTFFGVLPAYQASKLNPIESLRKAK